MRDLLELYQSKELVGRLAALDELVRPALTELTSTLGYERAFVVILDGERGHATGAVGVNVSDEVLDRLTFGIGEGGIIAQSLRAGRPVHVDDALRDPRLTEHERVHLADLGLVSFAVVPLLPASGALVVGKGGLVSEADINTLLPYAGRIVASVAQRTEAERQREYSEHGAIEQEWLWWLVNAVQDPILLTDEQDNVILKNSRAERLLAAGPEDSEGKRHAIRMNNFILSATLSGVALERGDALGHELTLVDPIEGDELLFDVISKPATNLRTGDRGFVWILKDVTDLRRAGEELVRSLARQEQAGEALRRERDRLDLILANVADPIVVTDPAGDIMLMNQRAQRLFQASATTTLERSAGIYLGNDAKLFSFLSQFGLEAAQVRHGEIQLIDPDTEEALTMSVTATEVRDALDQVTAIVSVLHDLTKIRELERRTLEQQLGESEKMAAVGRLAASVAHEINNPLEAIKNALYLLVTRTATEDPNRQFLEIAQKETERVSGIIRQMLGLYRTAPAKAPVDVNRILEETMALLERQFRRHRITLHMDLNRRLPSVLGSADQLKQVFLNLCLNAKDAMPGGGALYVSTRVGRETDGDLLLNGLSVVVQIRDSGVGIPEENVRYIFEPFYSTKGGRGTGLGLWVSQDIIKQHGGQMRVRSRPGRGATFTIALPVEGEDG
jgi:signal transduction histidine kinase